MKNGSVMIENGKITLTGVVKVISNNSRLIAVKQGDSTLTINGDNFNVIELNIEAGRFSATGDVKEMKFSGAHEKQDFIKKIFK